MYRVGSKSMTGKEKLLEAIKPWLCCNRPRHNNKKYHDLEKSGDSSGKYQIEASLLHRLKKRTNNYFVNRIKHLSPHCYRGQWETRREFWRAHGDC